MVSSIEKLGHEAIKHDYSFRQRNSNRYEYSYGKPNKKLRYRFFSSLPQSLMIVIKACVRLFWAYKIVDDSYDRVVIGGGQLVLSNKNFAASMFAWVLASKLRGIQVSIVSVGVGTEFTHMERHLFKWCLFIAHRVSVRDQESKNTLHSVFNYKNAREVSDCVYSIYEGKCIDGFPDARNQVLVAPAEYGVHLRYHHEIGLKRMSIDEYEEFWMDLIKGYSRRFSSLLITGTTEADFVFAKRLCILCEESNIKTILVESKSWQSYRGLAQDSKLVVSARMHGLILAQIADVSIEAVIISKKLESFKSTTERYQVTELKARFYNELSECLD